MPPRAFAKTNGANRFSLSVREFSVTDELYTGVWVFACVQCHTLLPMLTAWERRWLNDRLLAFAPNVVVI